MFFTRYNISTVLLEVHVNILMKEIKDWLISFEIFGISRFR